MADVTICYWAAAKDAAEETASVETLADALGAACNRHAGIRISP